MTKNASWVATFLVLCACGPGERAVTIDLRGRVGDAPFACGTTYEGLGTSATTLEALDFRLYVHDVRVVTASGAEVPVALTDDGVWQNGGVALIDFEDGTSGCESGNAPTNTRLVGTIPTDAAEITGVRFRIGVPASRNHLDAATAPSPLNLTSMFWGWQDGYKYLRVDGRTPGQPDFRLHLGATGCSGDATLGTRTCARPHISEVAIDGFDPDRDVLVADLAALFAGSDLDVNTAGTAPGCMGDDDDADCAPMFEALGLTDGISQSFFRAEPVPTR